MLNVTMAVYSTGNKVRTAPLYQWDYGQILQFEGLDLPANFEAHFSNTPMTGTAITVIGNDNRADIPDSLLQSGGDIWCWVYLHDEVTDGETEYVAVIPVTARPKRDGTEPTPEEQDAIAAAIEALNDATEVLDDAIAHTETYRDQAEAYAIQSESWAIGGTDTRQGEDTDNAKYYRDQAEATAQRVTEAVDYFVDTTVPQAIQSVEDEGTAQIALVDAEGATQIGAVGDEGTAQIALVGAEGTRQVGIVSGEGATQKGNVSAEGSAQVGNVRAEGNAQIGLVQSEGSTQIGYVESAGTTQVGNVNSAGASQVSAVQSAGSAQIGLVQAEGTAQISAVGSAGTTQIGLVGDKGTEQIGLVQAEGATQIAAVEAKGEEVLSEMIDKAPIITDTASGAIASFPDGAAMPVKSVAVEIEPVQDLHGYDNPWPAGGGKNLRSGIDLANDFKNRIASATIDTTNKTVSFAYNAAETAGQYIPRNVTFKENTQYTFIITVLNPSAARANLCIAYTDGTISNFPDLSAANAKETVTVNSTANKTVRSLAIKKQGGSSTIYYDESGIFEGANQSWTPYSNICPITGWTGANVTGAGKNLLSMKAYSGGSYNPTVGTTWNLTESANQFANPSAGVYTISFESSWSSVVLICPVKQNKYYHVSYSGSTTSGIGRSWGYLDKNFTVLTKSSETITSFSYDSTWVPGYAESTKKAAYIYLLITNRSSAGATITINNPQIELGSTAADFAPYAGTTYPITWQTEAGTVYGGTATVNQDGSADLAAEWANIESYAGESLPGEWISDRDVYAPGTTPTTGAQVVYKLATPVTYTLTAPQMQTLLGQNNWWADTGDVTVNYRADTKLYIDKKLAALLAALS